MCRKFKREILKLLPLFVKQSVFSRKSAREELQPSASILGSRHSASSSSTKQPSRLFSSRESLADEPGHSGINYPGLDRHRSCYHTNGMVDLSAILQGAIARGAQGG